jgi:hypothetical protein
MCGCVQIFSKDFIIVISLALFCPLNQSFYLVLAPPEQVIDIRDEQMTQDVLSLGRCTNVPLSMDYKMHKCLRGLLASCFSKLIKKPEAVWPFP